MTDDLTASGASRGIHGPGTAFRAGGLDAPLDVAGVFRGDDDE